ncbi:MAG: hypothetical protein OEM41_02260 [Ignavibacteria bacterium]|nr:hypothetical protein [Ignavibacteria bacterium]
MPYVTKAAALVLTLMLANSMASALPRFASRTGAKCQACHVNPSGGGMRQTFGVNYGRDELPVPTWSEELGMEDFSTKISDVVSIGADFRTLFYYQQTAGSNSNAFWQMQGDIYLNLRIARKVSMYLDKGLYNGFEVFGLLNILPGNGFVKVGKFVPNYGTKLDDHRAFVREKLGFSPELGRPERTGAEIGFAPEPLVLTTGVFNAEDGFGFAPNNKALLGRIDFIQKLGEDVRLGLAGNVLWQEKTSGLKTTLLGGLGSISYKRLTVTGEVDLIKKDSVGRKVDGLALYAEANVVLTQGVDLKFGYDFYDPDTDVKSGSQSRYTVGVEFFPLSGVEVRPLYRINSEDPVNTKNNEFHLLVHFYL